MLGRLFREFAITLAVAILISLVVSLTLTPMMCARLLKREPKEEEQSRFYKASGAWIDWLIARYASMLQWVLKHQPLTLLVAIATLGLTVTDNQQCGGPCTQPCVQAFTPVLKVSGLSAMYW